MILVKLVKLAKEHWRRGTMYKLGVPKVLKRGDTIALISISGGRAGDEDMLYRYEVAKSDWRKYGAFMLSQHRTH